jgi:hypothetical protein
MRYEYSAGLRDDVNSAVHTAFTATGIINIAATAEQVRVRNLAENVALEDIECLVLQAAQLLGAAIEFDTLRWLWSHGLRKIADGPKLDDLRNPSLMGPLQTFMGPLQTFAAAWCATGPVPSNGAECLWELSKRPIWSWQAPTGEPQP